MRETGTAIIEGVARVQEQTKATLSFSFDSDQSFLAETLREVEVIELDVPTKASKMPIKKLGAEMASRLRT
jgi:hypothetical protein